MSVYKKLLDVQSELKAPKGQENKFGGYRYRSCEDILEAVKPLLKKSGLALTVGDEIVTVSDRVYVKATATVVDIEDDGKVSNTAFAREQDSRKGMDDSQITGSASSYARKYALNGLFCIDDTKDADTLPPQDDRPKCKECGKVIRGGKAMDGHMMTSEEVAKKTDGLCMTCFKMIAIKARDAQEGE